MSVSAAVALALLLGAPSSPEPVSEPIPLAIHVGAPGALTAEIRRVEEGIAAELAARSAFVPSTARALGYSESALEGCRESGSLACFLRVGWRDLLEITLRAEGAERLRVAVLFLRPTAADRLRARTASIADDVLDEALFARAIAFEREIARGDPAGLEAIARELCERAEVPALGALAVESVPEGARLTLDGAALGAVTGGRLALARVASGRHRLQLELGGRLHSPIELEVQTGTVTRVVAGLDPEPEGDDVPLYGGLGLAAGGLALGVVALVAPADHRVCLGPCSGGFTGFGEGSGGGSAILIAPLGLGLLAAGATWASAPLWLGGRERARFLGLALGVLAGVGVYAIAAGAGG